MLDQMLKGFAGLFEARPAQPAGHRREPWELPLLVTIVLIGTILRFWGLGSVGLHGNDEDTTALPAVHLAEHGTPQFPSGMYYARAIAQTYMIAASVRAFGESEWSIRFPSAVCGVLLIVLAYFLGRRFLKPVWNAAFVASVALLPDLILLSQNARMYIFLVACIAAFTVFVFKWEETTRLRYLAAATVMLLIGIQFQTLMILALPILFFPALLHASWRRLLGAAIASAVVIPGYKAIEHWMRSYYPQLPRQYEGETLVPAVPVTTPGSDLAALDPFLLALVALVALGAAVLVWLVVRRVQGAWGRAAVAGLLFLGLCAQATLNYHLAFVLLVAGAVTAMRNSRETIAPMLIVAAASIMAMIGHIAWLHLADVGTRGVIAGIMMGTPTAWPFYIFGGFSPAAMIVVLAGAASALWLVSSGQKIGDYWLYFAAGVWAPLLVISAVEPAPAQRYLVGALLPLLVGAFFVGQTLVSRYARGRSPFGQHALNLIGAAVLLVAVINPAALARAVNTGYEVHPDHKGAAEYIQSLQLTPGDIVLAEDVIMQTYYLGRVDYWLIGPEVGHKFAPFVDGFRRDIYTNTPIVTTAEALRSLVDDPDRGTIYIISSAENLADRRLSQRGASLQRVLDGAELEVAFVGRDGLTTVWRIPTLRALDAGSGSVDPPIGSDEIPGGYQGSGDDLRQDVVEG